MSESIDGLVGRELDAAVAVRVMGWKIAPEGNRWRVSATGDYNNSWCVDSPNLADLDSDTTERLYGRYAMPAFSSEITAAMDVVEKLRSLGFHLELITAVGGWEVSVYRRYARGGEVVPPLLAQYEGLSLPEAICRAALAARQNEESHV